MSTTETQVDTPIPPAANGWFYPRWLLTLFVRPRATFANIQALGRPVWQTSMLFLSLTLLGLVLATGYFRQQALRQGEITLPPNFEWLSPEQQAQFFQTQELTSGPVFMYFFPLILGFIGLWVGWLITSSILHLMLTFMGGRGESFQASNIVAWSLLPFALRDIVRIVATLVGQSVIQSPGLAGFAPDGPGFAMFVAQLLTLIDIYLIWHIVLLIVGVRVAEPSLPRLRVVFSIVALSLVLLLAQAGLGTLGQVLTDLTVTRPFFF